MIVEEFFGNKKIIHSGMVLKEREEDLVLDVDTEANLKFKIRVKLALDPDNKGIDIKTVDTEEGKEIVFTNHGIPSVLGTGPSKPVEIGTIRGKELSFFYVTYQLYDGQFYKIEYTFYEG